MNLHLPLLLLGATTAATNAELDLYVREKFETSDGSECASCDESAADCHLYSRAFFLQGSCFNRGYNKASVYDLISNGDVVCRQDTDASCENADHEFDDAGACKDAWTVDECTEGEKMSRLEGWCKELDEAEGEYTIPLLEFREYDDVDLCDPDSSAYTTLLLPNEGGNCMPLSFKSDGAYISGSRKVSCKNDVYNAVRYADPDCAGDAVTISLFDGTSGTCPASSDADRIYTNDCGAPSVYCKASDSFSGKSTETPSAGSNKTPSTGSGAGGDSAGTGTTPGGILLVAMALLSWVA